MFAPVSAEYAEAAQRPIPIDSNWVCEPDTLDPLPPWDYQDFCRATVRHLRNAPPLPEVRERTINADGDTIWAVPTTPRRSWNEFVRLLAWSSAQAITLYGRELYDTTTYSDTVIFQHVVLWVQFTDSSSLKRVALVFMSAFTRRRDPRDRYAEPYSSDGWHLGTEGRYAATEYSLKIYENGPTNSDIYDFVEQWTKWDEGGFNFFTSPRFLDGDVRERTWQAAIGEAATRFLPNGK